MAPRGKKKAHATDARTAWAIVTLVFWEMEDGEMLNAPERGSDPDCELLEKESGSPLFPCPHSSPPPPSPHPPPHWGEAMTDANKTERKTEKRKSCILNSAGRIDRTSRPQPYRAHTVGDVILLPYNADWSAVRQ